MRIVPFSRPLIAAACAFLGGAVLSSGAPAAGEETPLAAKWTKITYPGQSVAALPDNGVSLAILPADAPPALICRFSIRETLDVKAFHQPGRMAVRLHYPDGTIVEPISAERPKLAGGGMLEEYRDYRFAYGGNSLTRAWVEMRFDEKTYWFEIPSGFARNPADPPPPADSLAEPARFAPAMRDSPPDSKLVRLSSITYDLGTIQNGWQATVTLFHPSRTCRLVLTRPEGAWEIHRPIAEVKVEMDHGATLGAKQFASYLSEHLRRRQEDFILDAAPVSGRGWSRFILTMDGKPWSEMVPMSAFATEDGTGPWKH